MKPTLGSPGSTLPSDDPKVSLIWRFIRSLFESAKKKAEKYFPFCASTFDKVVDKSSNFFPGAHPKSLCSNDIPRLCEEEHVCCEKTDGVRYLFFQTSDKRCYLMDRRCTIYQPRMEYLNVQPAADLKNALLSQLDVMADGELVEDEMDGRKVINYLIYDALWVSGKNCMALNYVERLSNIVPLVMDLRYNFFDSSGNSIIRIYVKDMFSTKDIGFVLEKVLPNLPHRNDGVIFTKIDCPYYPGTCNEILKWKPVEKNTVDCILMQNNAIMNAFPRCYELQCSGPNNSKEFFDMMFFNSKKDEDDVRQALKYYKDTKGVQGILECYYDPEYWTEDSMVYNLFLQENLFTKDKSAITELTKDKITALRNSIKSYDAETLKDLKGGWRIERIRNDKDKPNFIKVALNVKASIADKITSEVLMNTLSTANPKNLALKEQDVSEEENVEENEEENEESEDGGFSLDFLMRKREFPVGDNTGKRKKP
eukprot:TRINITY_DN3050_c0_g3_i2.p1 TRINITY_DN3050_c0_g3~~TRINITY_DN3050_c0_g3_i2.p1  ORF type:complete len:516 (+),score=205.63 TRINITY_DN3050_c0_g3_i2:103-1548(+)